MDSYSPESRKFSGDPQPSPPLVTESVLREAERLTSTDRRSVYDDPTSDFARTAAMWSALFGRDFSASDVARAMICLKLSRSTASVKRDNAVDIAGYASCLWECEEKESSK